MTTLASALTHELFQRTRASASIGTIGVGIMLYPHFASVAPIRSFIWAGIMLGLLGARFLNSRRNVEDFAQERQVMRLCNFETLLCALLGLGWGSAVFIFDSKAMDPLFYLTFMNLGDAPDDVRNSRVEVLR